MEQKITKKLLKNGIEKGIIQIINNPNDSCIAAQIGEYWFYFTGSENEDLSAEEYLRTYSTSEIVDMLYDAINSFRDSKETMNEFLYYKCVLEENQ